MKGISFMEALHKEIKITREQAWNYALEGKQVFIESINWPKECMPLQLGDALKDAYLVDKKFGRIVLGAVEIYGVGESKS